MRKIRLILGTMLLAATCGAVLFADTFAAITGSGVGGAFITGDIWTAAIAEQVRQNFNVLQTRLTAVEAAYITASSTTTLTNKTLNAESTGNVLTLPFVERWPLAICFDPNGTTDAYEDSGWSASATPLFHCRAGSNTFYATKDFADSATTKAYRHFLLPADWTGAIDLQFAWLTSATTGNVVWQVSTACSAAGETLDPSLNAANTVTDAAQGTTLFMNTAALTGITTTGCAAGEMLHLVVFRDASHASDTLAATAELIEVAMTYRRAM